MNRFEYYESLKKLARKIRTKYNINSFRVMPSEIKKILKKEGVEYIDLSEQLTSNVRGIYFNDEDGISILVKKNLPTDPYAFTLAHELKHHLVDSDLELISCTYGNIDEEIEIGAEIFAAEFIFPEKDFENLLLNHYNVKKGTCKPNNIVILKKETSTTLSYSGLKKRAIFLKFATENIFKNIKWKQLEYSIYGIPYHIRKYTRKVKKMN